MLELCKTPRDDLNVPCIEMWRRRFSTATGLACVAYTSWAPGSPGLCAGGLLRGEWAETCAWIQVSPLHTFACYAFRSCALYRSLNFAYSAFYIESSQALKGFTGSF